MRGKRHGFNAAPTVFSARGVQARCGAKPSAAERRQRRVWLAMNSEPPLPVDVQLEIWLRRRAAEAGEL